MDPLSLAVLTVHAFFEGQIPDPWWWDLSVWRLISGGGWMVSGTHTKLFFDDDVKVIAA